MRESRNPSIDSTKISIPDKPGIPEKPIGEEKKLTLAEFTNNIAISLLKSKAMVDQESARIKREIYERDEMLKTLPLTTFDISEVEVELKFIPSRVERGEVVINVDPEILTKAQNAVSSVRFRFTSRKLSEYLIEGKEKIIK